MNRVKVLGDAIDRFIKSLLMNYECNSFEREFLSLPAKLGGLGIIIPSKISDIQIAASKQITRSLVNHVIEPKTSLDIDKKELTAIKSKLKNDKKKANNEKLQRVKEKMSSERTKLLECTLELVASSWLSTFPIAEQGLYLNNESFFMLHIYDMDYL